MSTFHEMRKVAWQTIVEAFNLSVATDANLIFQAKTYTVATVPTAASYPRGVIYVSNETGGATLAFSDGTNWRRVQDRAVVS
jgi:hypothetical protein